MALSVQAPHFTTAMPAILNSGNELTIALPLINIGPGAAAEIKATAITLNSATRLSPAGLPWFVGNLAPHNTALVSPRFDSSGLAVGLKYLLTVRGTYEMDGATYGFAVNRYIVVPAASQFPIRFLKVHVEATVAPGIWAYTIFNDELPGSHQFVASFSLDVVASVTVTGVPPGWTVETDSASYVLWTASDQRLPYPNHIAPGSSLGGFQIESVRSRSESTGYLLTGWNHQSDNAGLIFPDLVLSPSREF